MRSKKLNENNKKFALLLSRMIIAAFLFMDLYLILEKGSIISKSLAGASYIGFMSLLILSLFSRRF